MKKTTLQLAEEARGYIGTIRKEVYNGNGNEAIDRASRMAQTRVLQLVRALEQEVSHE